MIHRPRIRSAVVCATVFGATTCGLLGPVSIARTAQGQVVQFSTSSVGSPRQGSVDRRDVDLMDTTVNLDEAQREIIDALHAGYTDQYSEESSAHRDYVRSLYQNAGDNADWEAIMAKAKVAEDQWQINSERLNAEFLSSVREILSEDQLDRWPVVERDRRRRSLLSGHAKFSGENVDLINLVEDIDLQDDQRQAIDPTLNAWADEMDALLQARKTASEQWEKNVQEPMAAGNPPDAERAQEWRDRVTQRRRALRDLNLRYAEIMPTQLPYPVNTEFTTAFNLAAYHGIYRPTAADRYIDTALGLTDLVTEQTEAIEMIERGYDSQALLINDQLASILRTDEENGVNRPSFGMPMFDEGQAMAFGAQGGSGVVNNGGGSLVAVHSIEITTDGGGGMTDHVFQGGEFHGDSGFSMPLMLSPAVEPEDPDSPKGRLGKSKQELIQRTIDSVFAILSLEQQALHPKPGEREMLSPEERMRRRMEKAFSNMVIDHDGEGNVRVEMRLDDEDTEN